MRQRVALLLLVLAAVVPATALAKAIVPSEKPPVEEIAAEPPVETSSREVTEVVTTEDMTLEPVEEPEKKLDEWDQPDFIGERSTHLFQSEWGVLLRVADYNPKGNVPAGASADTSLGLRYKLPDRHGAYYQLAYELTYNTWGGATANLDQVEFAVEVFAKGSPALRLKHHPYYGIGIGNIDIGPSGKAGFSENTLSIFGGVEFPGRRLDYDVFIKYIYATDARYDLDDVMIGLGAVYTFGHGR